MLTFQLSLSEHWFLLADFRSSLCARRRSVLNKILLNWSSLDGWISVLLQGLHGLALWPKTRTRLASARPAGCWEIGQNFATQLVFIKNYSLSASFGCDDNNTQHLQKKLGTAVNTACQETRLVCHFGHACYSFVSPGAGFYPKLRTNTIRDEVNTNPFYVTNETSY
jgi:hypothetical protein